MSGFMEGPLTFRGYDMDYYRSLLNKTEEEEKTDVPFKILNQELLPYNIIKKYSQAKREERKEKLREERENTKIWKDKSDCIVNKGFFFKFNTGVGFSSCWQNLLSDHNGILNPIITQSDELLKEVTGI